jgi:ubiquinol-cytochrome c reductase cytochrome b subunit
MTEQENRISWLRTTGGVVVILLVVQFMTGVLLTFYYVPSVDHAYTSISYVEKVVSSGSWIRSLHHYGSQWLTLFVFIHVIQLFLAGAYGSRRIQWIAAVLVLGLVMAAGGTGYSLPWDARAFFSTRVAEGLVGGLPLAGRIARLWVLGGSEISTLTLSRFFALHVLLIPAVIIGVVVWRLVRARVCWSNLAPHVIAGGLVFVLLAIWCWKHPAPLGPSVTEATADYLPRPGSQFLWLYQSLKYLPGGLGSIAGLVLPGIALLVLVFLPWLRSQRLIGSVILSIFVLLIGVMTTASYLSDRRDPRTAQQLARQAAQEEAARHEPFKPVPLSLVANAASPGVGTGEPPVLYDKFCANCHGQHGEGVQRGALKFPPLLDVSTKPHRTVDDIVALLHKPETYGLQPPMRSFSDKLNEEQMRQIAEWVVTLKR